MDRSSMQAAEQALRRLEPIFHGTVRGTTRAEHAAMVSEDFSEVGASGRCYGRDQVLDVLAARGDVHDAAGWRVEDFRCRTLAESVYLVTYTLHQGARVSRRSTIWRHGATGWQALYHQGTLVPGEA